ncbi:hypothetical protein CHU32_24610 [Superficieibacter electus]|uniref:Uncharacterized protein n=1 Tax=Superficieibacter electus TaxID=2022662 RepID=A0A2P5GI41_9ENTR|nr:MULTISPECIES: hypothetical protein [Superficieibacter]POP41750.1 hypothetical protein CHU33_21825 [Superficieibacter electus]POP42562.1 hypothetical protein CHU32_24610 [Superficieibacter electus]WES69150.1 hypothetical protein P0H77_03820 [Superficieibacter sp. HKU1]
MSDLDPRVEAIVKEALMRKEGIAAERFAIHGTTAANGETIEQRTLSAVLSSALHQIDADQAGDVAVKLAQAVKSAFQTLNSGFAAGGYISSQWGIKLDSTGSLATENVDKSECSDCESDVHDPVSLKDIKASREDDMLTIGNYPGAHLSSKLAVNAAAAETSEALSKEMNEVIGTVVLNVIKEQSKPGGLLYRQ